MKKHTPIYRRDIAQIDKSFLKGRLQEAVFCDDEVIAICGDDEKTADKIVRILSTHDALVHVLIDFINYISRKEKSPQSPVVSIAVNDLKKLLENARER